MTLLAKYVEADPGVLQGKPVVRGTRLSVELILRRMAEGANEKDLISAYPHLTSESIRGVLAFAADTVGLKRCDWFED
jgi:uncharacterized protein (DUF433 family)